MKLLVLIGDDFDKAVEFAKKRLNLTEDDNVFIHLASTSRYPQDVITLDENENIFDNHTTYDIMQEFGIRRDYNFMDSFIVSQCTTIKNENIVIDSDSMENEYKVESTKYYPAWGIAEFNLVSVGDRIQIGMEG